MDFSRGSWNPTRQRFFAVCALVACQACGDGAPEPSSEASGGGTGAGGSLGGAAPSSGAGTGGSPMREGGGSGAGGGGNGGAATGGGGGSPAGGTTAGGGTGGSAVGGATAGGGGAAGSAAGGGGGGGAGELTPCPASGACRILPLGDSITDGLTVAGGYRIHLFELAEEAGKTITFVGREMNGPMMVGGETFPRAHEGHSGWTISQIDGVVPMPALAVAPHIVLLHIGTNDMYQSAANAEQRLGALVDQILEALPDALLIVSTIVPFPGSANNVRAYNAAVPGVVDARAKAGKHVLFVDQFTGFPTSELADGVHPNAAGYARMAKAWFAVVSKYLR